jgi:insertion element IS1 protein InsB
MSATPPSLVGFESSDKRQYRRHWYRPAELDELHTFVGKKKGYRWVWLGVDRKGHRYMTFVVGDRSSATGKKFWTMIKDVPMLAVATDYWKPYEDFVPPELPLLTKAETYTVEGYNCRLRH